MNNFYVHRGDDYIQIQTGRDGNAVTGPQMYPDKEDEKRHDFIVSACNAAMAVEKPKVIELTKAEIQSGLDRVRWAEGLIRHLPENHEGRNSWLLNYGQDKNNGQAKK